MRKRPRTWLATVVGGVALALVAACGSSASSTRGATTDAAGNTTLTWAMWTGGTAERDLWQSIADAVHAADPTLTVALQTSGFDDYFTKIMTRTAAGTEPCIVSVNGPRIASMKVGLVPLDELMARSRFESEKFAPSALRSMRQDDRQWAIPYDSGPVVLYFNKDLFAAAGVPPPAEGWTQQQFFAAAEALTRNGRYGVAIFPNDMYIYAMMLAATGKQPVAPAGTMRLTDPDLVAAFQRLTDLVNVHRFAPPLPGSDGNFATNQFLQGRAAMALGGPWDVQRIKEEAGFTPGAVSLPSGSGGSKTLTAGSGFGISRSCPVPEKAFAAIKVLTNEEQLTKLAESGRALPARTAAQPAWYRTAFPGAEPAFRAAVDTAETWLTTKNAAKDADAFAQFGIPAFNGSTSAAEALRQVELIDGS